MIILKKILNIINIKILTNNKARVIWTLISAVMSSLLYQLSYNLLKKIGYKENIK